MTHPTAFRSRLIPPARSAHLRFFPALLLLATGCGAQVADLPADSNQTAVPSIANNSFTWGAIDYTIRSANWLASTAGSYVQLELDATNRIRYGTTSLLDWDLQLADGSIIAQTDNRWFNLEPAQTHRFSLQFSAAEHTSLSGAQLVPHQSDLNYAPAHIPLDRPSSDAPLVLHQLVGKVLATQSDTANAPAAANTARQWIVTIKSAQISPNSDVDGGERALADHQFVDVVFDVHYPATNAGQAYFGADLASVEVEDSPAYEFFDSLILQPNQTGEVHFAFEVATDATQFVLNVNTDDTHTQSLTVPLAELLR